ncbi:MULTISPECIES: 23S rRNA (uridine(2552)-2'-O)-methyltransferase RlmE [unclassified Methylophaga]|jgi:23S rRNA (uridine2552-2'-O)-methyltransferase|uniref:23S rRNA (uridine(2552)-2'-O)-methyltransferase RlmE n=1 Tax=unclassified Methylophaga TaxID=2629249 RepID=UPI000C8B3355|nr:MULTISPECIES: 23S rRNA (uridine(2552)-2'-O)-methyltransferase RlmE [unclassified Methylophaga]MAK66458.1 23S rRNA (uridine(2552)-2'-O)-methyltransferase RlmE [Methylophaga sp.]MAY17152.1 23S rRNA (uridine(2552)-2'-O)-methyltransferase RlmE [Methylophaga sp.]MBN46055.1 23S rRNA (uridine(2552)-2'-O)-methyltransferase RlmE [Methylophaga sp.]HAO23504.1 23S rRNA (uridine(2552)-2'-O)-methyltransferase RlmE [Methylophaga sp.]HCD04123.1 23S rRNA (uridine(2552)-2'-O)-methyltransferase RlmE [Methylop|tara:strand:+ start:15660 stop:16277 length:618 start_codon:yes stop_codon:yes gene_type:complete
MARSKSSHNWLREHFDDPYVKKAQQKGYRSRATFKLEEIDQKDKLIRHGMSVVDLGSAPGGWSDYALHRVGDKGKVIALDILPMTPLSGVHFIEGDFREDHVLDQLNEVLAGQSIDLVLSDMAPNMTGVDAIDQPGSMHLVELALDFAINNLSKQGDFLVKVFQGEGFDDFLKSMRTHFTKVTTRKPDASRARSREVYLLGRGLK